MIIYIFEILFMLILAMVLKPNRSRMNRKVYLIMVFGGYTAISMVRASSVGADTRMYESAFINIASTSFENLNSFRYEYGFTLLCKLLSFISKNPQILIIVTSAFIIPIVGRFIYINSNDVILSSYIFMTLNIYFMYMTAIRQAIAIAIVLLGFEYLKKNKKIKYCLIVVLASLFHQSAIICIFFLVFNKYNYTLKTVSLTLIIAIVSFFSYTKLFSIFSLLFPDYSGYNIGIFSVSNYFGAVAEASVAAIILFFGVYYLYIKKSINDKETQILAFIISSYFIFNVLVIKMNVVNRVTCYFTVFVLLWIPKVIKSIKNRKKRAIIYVCIYILFFIYWLVIIITRPEWTQVVPYKVFFK